MLLNNINSMSFADSLWIHVLFFNVLYYRDEM